MVALGLDWLRASSRAARRRTACRSFSVAQAEAWRANNRELTLLDSGSYSCAASAGFPAPGQLPAIPGARPSELRQILTAIVEAIREPKEDRQA